MKLQFDPADLRPLIATVAAEVLAQVDADRATLGDRLAIPEAEAAAMISCKPYQLRDMRLRGEIEGVRLGKRICYTRDALMELLRRNRLS